MAKSKIQVDDDGNEVDLNKQPPEESFDNFLRDMHQTTETGDTNGMPSLEWLKSNLKTKSGTIRYLGQLGFNAKQISRHIGIHYQHAYNVLHQNLKRGPNEVFTEHVWQCSHTKASIIVDVILRQGTKDPNTSRILYRVCASCAKDVIPGVTDDAIQRNLPGVKS